MGDIKAIKKYNPITKKFDLEITDENRGDAFSNIRERARCNKQDEQYDYIVFCNGNRVRDVSKDNIHPIGQRRYAERIVKYFEAQNKNVIVEYILLDNDAPLDTQAQLIARHIDHIANHDNIRSVQLIGHSKAGAIFFNTPKYFNSENSFQKSYLYTTATPYNGCLIASKEILFEEAKKITAEKLPPPINVLTYEGLIAYYKTQTGDSHMEKDIAIKKYKQYDPNNYDPLFIQNMFCKETIQAVSKLQYFHNFVTGIDENTIYTSIQRNDFTSVGMCLIDKYIIPNHSDGFIEESSQRAVSDYIDVPTTELKSTTHYFLSHDDELAKVLDVVNNQIDKRITMNIQNRNYTTIKGDNYERIIL